MPSLVEKLGSSRTRPLDALTIRELPSASGTVVHVWLAPPLNWYWMMSVPLLFEDPGSSSTRLVTAFCTLYDWAGPLPAANRVHCWLGPVLLGYWMMSVPCKRPR